MNPPVQAKVRHQSEFTDQSCHCHYRQLLPYIHVHVYLKSFLATPFSHSLCITHVQLTLIGKDDACFAAFQLQHTVNDENRWRSNQSEVLKHSQNHPVKTSSLSCAWIYDSMPYALSHEKCSFYSLVQYSFCLWFVAVSVVAFVHAHVHV